MTIPFADILLYHQLLFCSIPGRFSPPKRKKSRRSPQTNPTARRMSPSASGERMFSASMLARGLSTLIRAPTLARLSALTVSKPQICCSLFSAKAPLVKSSPVKNVTAVDEGSPIGKKRKHSRKLVLSSDEEEEENVSPKYTFTQIAINNLYSKIWLLGLTKKQQWRAVRKSLRVKQQAPLKKRMLKF
jgi:hypothetical protein